MLMVLTGISFKLGRRKMGGYNILKPSFALYNIGFTLKILN